MLRDTERVQRVQSTEREKKEKHLKASHLLRTQSMFYLISVHSKVTSDRQTNTHTSTKIIY